MDILKKTPVASAEKKPVDDRIILLSDGVFAIAMTLLILDIKLPDGLPHVTLLGALKTIVPNVVSYASKISGL